MRAENSIPGKWRGELLLNTLWVDPVIGGVGSFVSEAASCAALAASICIAAALLLSGRVPSDLAGWANMAVPIAFALLILAAVWMRWRSRNGGPREAV